MNREFQTKLNEFAKTRKTRRKWLTVVASLCAVVAVGTSYLLINPAVTQQQETFCGFEEHKEHGEECYEEIKTLICPLSEEGHIHSESCYESVLTCGKEETDGHQHSAGCFAFEPVLTCENMDETHVHSDECCEMQEVLVCTEPEVEPHHHDESCFTKETACGQEEFEPHQHTDECWEIEQKLICELPIHEHTLQCFSNPEADVETEESWSSMTAAAELTGNWSDDVLSIAQTQLGYGESRDNYLVQEDGATMNGYTRYGDWYGDGCEYENWDAMFCAFCLHYAGVDESLIPVSADCEEWKALLSSPEIDLYREADSYVPVPGDLVFLTTGELAEDGIRTAERVGFVKEADVDEATGEPVSLITVEGDMDGEVGSGAYAWGDERILGFAQIPLNPEIPVELTEAAAEQTEELSAEVQAEAVTIESEPASDGSVAVITGNLPENATAEIEAVYLSGEELIDYVGCEQASHMKSYVAYDIRIMVDGMEWQPAPESNVKVVVRKLGLAAGPDDQITVTHIEDETGIASQIETTINSDGEISFDTNGFSIYIFTVDFTYDDLVVSIEGYDEIFLSELFLRLSIEKNPADVIAVEFSNEEYIAVSQTADGDWKLTSLQSFSTEENLIVRFIDGAELTIRVTDPPQQDTTPIIWLDGTDGGYKGSWNGQSNGTHGLRPFWDSLDYNISDTTQQDYAEKQTLYNWVVTKGDGNTYTVRLPETWQSPASYPYQLNGWYDINKGLYYEPGDTATVSENTVFYADWIPVSYDVGQDNEHVVDTLNTSSFTNIRFFDYSILFNVMSTNVSSEVISNTSHLETWSLQNRGSTVTYKGLDGNNNSFGSLDFILRDWDAVDYDSKDSTGNSGEPWRLSYPRNVEFELNSYADEICSRLKILTDSRFNTQNGRAIDSYVLDWMFDPDVELIGKKYVGEVPDTNLFQYNLEKNKIFKDIPVNANGQLQKTDMYGYFYYDSTRNAAALNMTDGRFYVYDYLERSRDSIVNGLGNDGKSSDFLPLNSPYIEGVPDGKYGTMPNGATGYTYNSNGMEQNDYDDSSDPYKNYQSASFQYGMQLDIDFYLPDDVPTNKPQNKVNQSAQDTDMMFYFSGDDDVWIFVDGVLLLDIGGHHRQAPGWINFSTGEILYPTKATGSGDTYGTTTINALFQAELGKTLTAGDHTLRMYYMERGSSESNCIVYFNITPRFGFDLYKEDAGDGSVLPLGTKFELYEEYEDGECKTPANVWHSQADYDQGISPSNEIVVDASGKASFWGLEQGKTYYLLETEVPSRPATIGATDPWYEVPSLPIMFTLKTDEDGAGFARVVDGGSEDDDQLIGVKTFEIDTGHFGATLGVTNAKNGLTHTVKKQWLDKNGNADNGNHPKVHVYLQRRIASDNEENEWETIQGSDGYLTYTGGWTYTWYNLPRDDGVGHTYEYRANEDWPYGYYQQSLTVSASGKTTTIVNRVVQEQTTELTVEKLWNEGSGGTVDHSAHGVKVRLLANGVDIDMEEVLDASNNWKYTFTNLPIGPESNPTVYTVEEIPNDEDSNYSYYPEYFPIYEVKQASGGGMGTQVSTIEDGKTCRFITSENKALAIGQVQDKDKWKTGLVVVDYAESDESQQWQCINGTLYNKADAYKTYSFGGGEGVTANTNEFGIVTVESDGKLKLTIQKVEKDGKIKTETKYLVQETKDGVTKYKFDGKIDGGRTAVYVTLYRIGTGASAKVTNVKNEMTKVYVEKDWKMSSETDAEDFTPPEGTAVTVQLYCGVRDSEEAVAVGESVKLNADNSWQYCFDDLPKYAYGVGDVENSTSVLTENTYFVTETDITDASDVSVISGYLQPVYTETTQADGDKTYPKTVITNVPSTVDITIVKTDDYGRAVVTGTATFRLYEDEELTKQFGDDWITSMEDGKITVTGLSVGSTYYLVETAAPDGYLPLTEPLEFTATIEGAIVPEDSAFLSVNEAGELLVMNQACYELPETGGVGTIPYALRGIGLMATALMCGFSMRRKRERRYER